MIVIGTLFFIYQWFDVINMKNRYVLAYENYYTKIFQSIVHKEVDESKFLVVTNLLFPGLVDLIVASQLYQIPNLKDFVSYLIPMPTILIVTALMIYCSERMFEDGKAWINKVQPYVLSAVLAVFFLAGSTLLLLKNLQLLTVSFMNVIISLSGVLIIVGLGFILIARLLLYGHFKLSNLTFSLLKKYATFCLRRSNGKCPIQIPIFHLGFIVALLTFLSLLLAPYI